MYWTVNGHSTYCYNGGKPLDPNQPTVVFIHGVLNDHSVWILQSRYFAHHGWNVLALDLPGHCKSAGPPAQSVEEASAWVEALLDAAGIQRAALVGHSFGSLVALETAARLPQRITQLALVGTAFPMRVSNLLLAAARDQPEKAMEMDIRFSHSKLAPPPSTLGPGTWLYGAAKALMKRVLASNHEVNLYHRGFKACDDYRGGDEAMAQVTCPTLFVLGQHDQMTQPKNAQSLIARARQGKVVMVEAGHQMMAEAPDEVLAALREFLCREPQPATTFA